jgi:hypothetical protein
VRVLVILSIFSAQSNKCTVLAFQTKVRDFGVKSVLIFGCPAASWGALYAIL